MIKEDLSASISGLYSCTHGHGNLHTCIHHYRHHIIHRKKEGTEKERERGKEGEEEREPAFILPLAWPPSLEHGIRIQSKKLAMAATF